MILVEVPYNFFPILIQAKSTNNTHCITFFTSFLLLVPQMGGLKQQSCRSHYTHDAQSSLEAKNPTHYQEWYLLTPQHLAHHIHLYHLVLLVSVMHSSAGR